MALVNVLLVKYEFAWVEVGGGSVPAAQRREAMIEMSGVLRQTEAITIAQALLAIWSQPREAIVAQGLPHGEGGPDRFYFEYFREGNKLDIPSLAPANLPRVVNVTVTEDQDGQVSVAPELVSHLAVEEARIQRILDRYAAGSADGFGRGNIGQDPLIQPRFARVRDLPVFIVAGALTGLPPNLVRSVPYVPALPMLLTGVTASLRNVGTTNTVINLLIDGATAATVTIPANRKLYHQAFTVNVPAVTTPVQYEMVTGGASAAGLVLQTHASLA